MKEFQLHPFLIKNNSINLLLNWKVTRYLFLFILIALPVSSLSIINNKSETVFLAVRLIQLVIFVFLGIVHSDLMEKRRLFTQYAIKEKFYFSFVLTLLIYGVLLLFYFIVKSNMQRMAVASSCAFLLPYMIVQAWNYFVLLQENKLMVWNGYKPFAENPNIVYLNTILINIRLSRKHQVKEESSFLINTPLNLQLGKLFNSFLYIEMKEGNVDIDLIGKNNTPYGWKFYAVTFGGLYKRMLDPEKSLQDNGNIKRNTTILAKRMDVS